MHTFTVERHQQSLEAIKRDSLKSHQHHNLLELVIGPNMTYSLAQHDDHPLGASVRLAVIRSTISSRINSPTAAAGRRAYFMPPITERNGRSLGKLRSRNPTRDTLTPEKHIKNPNAPLFADLFLFQDSLIRPTRVLYLSY